MTKSHRAQEINPLPLMEAYRDTHRLSAIFYWFIAILAVGLIAGILIVLAFHDVSGAGILALGLLSTLASIYFIRHQKFELTAAFLAVLLITLITLIATRGLGVHHLSVLGYPAILIVASLVTRKRTMAFIILFNLLCVAWLVFGELSGAYTPTTLVRSVNGDFFSVSIVLIVTAIMVRMISEAMFRSSTLLQIELNERKLAEEKYRNIFDNAMDGIFQSTVGGRFIRVNPAMARMYGYQSPEEMVDTITDISTQVYVDPHARSELRRRLADGEKLTGFETLDYRKDGTTFWTSMNVQTVHDEAGNILRYEGTVEDITDRKADSENLRERQHFIETILDTEPGTVYIYDLQERKNIFVNRDWPINYGYSPAETQESQNLLSEIIHPDDFPAITVHHERLKKAEDDKSIFEVEYRIRHKNGEWRWVQSRDTVFTRDAAGQVTQILGILHDITESKKSQNALIAGEKKYRQLFENMTSGFAVHKMIYDEHGKPVDYRYLEINPAFEKLTGVPVEVLLGRTLKELMPDTEDYWIEKFGHVASTGEPLAYTNFSRELDRHYETYAFCPELGTFAVVFNDATDKIKAQEEVQKLNEELKHRVRELEARNAELTQFTYTVSHDLKSPLVTINGYLGYLEQDAFSGNLERLRQDIQRVQEATRKMHRLLTELLELSRVGRLMNTPQAIQFDDLVREALDLVYGQLELRGITVHTQPNLPIVLGDRQRLIEVLQNLLDNAAKYMGDQLNPRIEIGQDGAEADKPVFFVEDNGIGIAPEFHEQIFGLFNKLDSRSEGTGIGLALVKRIVEVHGGRIWVESELGQGATFYFTLPVSG